MWVQETHRVPKSQQLWMGEIHIHYLNTRCPTGHHGRIMHIHICIYIYIYIYDLCKYITLLYYIDVLY